MKTYGVIPARLASTRLPRKLLLCETGRPLVQHTWEAATRAGSLAEVIIATDSEEIAAAARAFGARCEMTGEHPSGTDRIAEVVRRHLPDADIVVNVQGDEPEIDPGQIDLVVQTLREHTSAHIATLATPIADLASLDDPARVKVVCTGDGRALYFSRSGIPFCQEGNVDELLAGESPWLLHVGLYAYRCAYLARLAELPVSRLEQLERLEQLRALEDGAEIRIGVTSQHTAGIDTPADYARFVESHSRSGGF